jgi:hypothetical protein
VVILSAAFSVEGPPGFLLALLWFAATGIVLSRRGVTRGAVVAVPA